MIANGKTEDGDWNWRTFGTGQGFTADAIITGYLSAERIEAGSIGSGKLSKEVTDSLGKISALEEQLAEIKIDEDSIVSTVLKSEAYKNQISELESGIGDAMEEVNNA